MTTKTPANEPKGLCRICGISWQQHESAAFVDHAYRPSEPAPEPRGCPTPGACSCTHDELKKELVAANKGAATNAKVNQIQADRILGLLSVVRELITAGHKAWHELHSIAEQQAMPDDSWMPVAIQLRAALASVEAVIGEK
jgi:hypothetical protein